MEGKRISQLTPDTSPTTDDYIVTVDGTTGQNKRVDLGYLPVSDPQNDALDLKANASDTVNLTGNQTVAGVKTFSSSPVVPTATTGTQAVNKAQMDAADALKLNTSDNRVELRGVGFPQGVVSAPVGTTYIDTNATNGAIKWVKETGSGNTGWVVSVGDTGWRDAGAWLVNGWTAIQARVRRVDNTVYFGFEALNAAVSTSIGVFSIPIGFRSSVPTYSERQFLTTATNPAAVWRATAIGNNLSIQGATTSLALLYGTMSFQTNDAYPAALPALLT